MKKETLDNYYTNVFQGESEVLGLALPMTLIHKYMFNQGCALLEDKYDLIHSQMDVLATLYFNGKVMRPTELYEATIFSSGGMTKILKKLKDRNFISRVASAEDKRSMLVKITTDGEQIVLKAKDDLVMQKNEIFQNLNKNEKEQLNAILKKLVYNIFDK